MSAPERGPSESFRKQIVWLFLAALVIRSAAVAVQHSALLQDPDGYKALAENLLAHGVLGRGLVPSAYRPPLYPLTLVPCAAMKVYAPLGIAAWHAILGAATVVLSWQLARWLGLGRWAWLAAGLVAFDPILLHQSAEVMTETLATCLSTLTLVCLVAASAANSRRWAALAGFSLGLATLTRPTFLAFLASSPVVWVLVHRGKNKNWKGLAAMLLSCGAVLAPWALRNLLQLGAPVVGTTHGGYTLWRANNPQFYWHLNAGLPAQEWDTSRFDARVLAAREGGGPAAEVRNDRREYAAAWATIRGQPRDFVMASLHRIGRLWGVTPLDVRGDQTTNARAMAPVIAAFYGLELSLCWLWLLALAAQKRVGPWWWLLALAAAFTAVHALYWTDMRMRAPLVPAIAAAAAACVGWTWDWCYGRKSNADK